MNPILFVFKLLPEELEALRAHPETILELDRKSSLGTCFERTIHFFFTKGALPFGSHPLSAMFGTELVDCSALALGHLRLLPADRLSIVAKHLAGLELERVRRLLEMHDLDDLVDDGCIDDFEVLPDGESEGYIETDIVRLLAYYAEAASEGAGLAFYEEGAWSKKATPEAAQKRRDRLAEIQEALPQADEVPFPEDVPAAGAITPDELRARFSPFYDVGATVTWEHLFGHNETKDAILFDPDTLNEESREMLSLFTAAFADRLESLVPFAILVDLDSLLSDIPPDMLEDFGGLTGMLPMALGPVNEVLLVDTTNQQVFAVFNGELNELTPSLDKLTVTLK